jgi:hypothetical protein
LKNTHWFLHNDFQKNPIRRKMKKLILIISILLISCSSVNTFCPQEKVLQANHDLATLLERFNDIDKVANVTSRIALPPVIDNMQQIKRDTNDFELPGCMEPARNYLILYMESEIDGFIVFLAQNSNSQANSYFERSLTYIQKLADELDRVNNCTPNCEP